MRNSSRLIFLNCPLPTRGSNPRSPDTMRRIQGLMRIATRFNIPSVTIEFAGGDQHAEVHAGGATVRRTNSFDATRMPGFLEDCAEPGQQIVLCGYEAHVSVLQTALGLLHRQRSVAVVADAIDATSEQDMCLALDRMARQGAVPVSAGMLAFEWAESFDIATRNEIFRELPPQAPLKSRLVPAGSSASQVKSATVDAMSIGDRLKRVRREKGLTLSELGRLAGCSLPHLSRIENNKGTPSVSALARISAALGTEAHHFFKTQTGSPVTRARTGAAGLRPKLHKAVKGTATADETFDGSASRF